MTIKKSYLRECACALDGSSGREPALTVIPAPDYRILIPAKEGQRINPGSCVPHLAQKIKNAKRTQIEKRINRYQSDANAKNRKFFLKKRTQFYGPAQHKIAMAAWLKMAHGLAVFRSLKSKIKPKSNRNKPKMAVAFGRLRSTMVACGRPSGCFRFNLASEGYGSFTTFHVATETPGKWYFLKSVFHLCTSVAQTARVRKPTEGYGRVGGRGVK